MDRPYLIGLLVVFILACWVVIGSSLYHKYAKSKKRKNHRHVAG